MFNGTCVDEKSFEQAPQRMKILSSVFKNLEK